MALLATISLFYALSVLSGGLLTLVGYSSMKLSDTEQESTISQGLVAYPSLEISTRSVNELSAAEEYRKWAIKYGPVSQLQLGNTPIVIVNSAAAAKELFLGQTSALNSRPVFHVFHKIVSKSVLSIGTSPWDESCKKRRKAAATTLNRSRTPSYLPILKLESSEFVNDLFQVSGGKVAFDLEHLIHRLSLNLSLTLNYGTRIKNSKIYQDFPLFNEVIHIEEQIGKLRSVGSNFNNYIPFLRFISPLATRLGLSASPSHGADIRRRRIEYNRKLLDELKQRVKEGTDAACIQGGVLKDPESSTLTEPELLSISFSMMAGTETNTPTIAWAMLLLSRRPDVQAAALAAIRSAGVLNNDPLSVEGEVPYIEAFTKEILRFYSPLRLALPKATSGVAKWGDARIPKDTMVFLNSWACNRDPEAYTHPNTFAPERWLSQPSSSDSSIIYNDTPPATSHFSFGYGSRMCVASHVANKALYLVFLHLIGNFEILPEVPRDATGEGEEDLDEVKSGVESTCEDDEVIHPLSGIADLAHTRAAARPFKVRLVPRNETQLAGALNSL